MSTPAFTPGPWSKNCSHIYAPDGAIIAVVHNPGRKESDYPLVANRDLMAAAPKLYDACAAWVACYPPWLQIADERALEEAGCDPVEAALLANTVRAIAEAGGDQ